MSPRLVAARLPAAASSIRVIEHVWEAGDVLMPVDPDLSDQEMARLLARTRPHILLDGAERTQLDDPAPIGEDAALVIATSGTTGPPKGVVLGRDAIRAAARLSNTAVGAEPGERWLCCLPLAHIAGMMTVLRSRALGAEAIVHPRFSVDAIAAEADAAFVSIVPIMLRRLLNRGVDLRRFSRVLVGGAAVGDELVEQARATGAEVTVTYGMSETCGGVVYDGIPLPGVDVDVEDDGRISIASPTLMTGYRLDPVLTGSVLKEGRLFTQDRGVWDENHRLRVVERLDRTIITGGKNVSLSEVEEALRSHPAVVEATVRGERDEEWGQKVVAEVVTHDAVQPPRPQELTSYLRARLSSYKLPREIRITTRDQGSRRS